MTERRWHLALVALLAGGFTLFAAPALTQPVASTAAPAPVPRRDLTGYLGWFNANKSEVAPPYNDWYNRSLFGGASFGYYWTDHLKTEVEFAATSEVEIVSYRREALPDVPGLIGIRRDHYYSNRKLSVAQSYQFFRNAWFHPTIGAGVDLDWERHYSETPEQTIPISVDGRFSHRVVVPASETEPRATLRPKAFLLTGFKAYLTERAFFRTDLKIGGASQIDQVLWRFGFGVDF